MNQPTKHIGSGLLREDLYCDNGIGLVAQGGGVRGAFTMGALLRLHQLGFAARFDVCIGNSSGALALAYFLAGQAEIHDKYWAAMRSCRVISMRRPWRLIDIDRLINRVVFDLAPLNVERLRLNKSCFLIGLTDAQTRLPRYILAQELEDRELRDVFRATCALPGLHRGRINFQGRYYLDGGFVDSLPLLRLKLLGCDRIVVITTSPLEYSFTNDSWLRRSFIKLLSTGQHRLIRQFIGVPNPLHDENLEALLWWARDSEKSGVLAISPERSLPQLTSNVYQLHRVFLAGIKAADSAVRSVGWLQQ